MDADADVAFTVRFSSSRSRCSGFGFFLIILLHNWARVWERQWSIHCQIPPLFSTVVFHYIFVFSTSLCVVSAKSTCCSIFLTVVFLTASMTKQVGIVKVASIFRLSISRAQRTIGSFPRYVLIACISIRCRSETNPHECSQIQAKRVASRECLPGTVGMDIRNSNRNCT